MTNERIIEKVICKVKGYPYGCIIFPDFLQDKNYYRLIFSHSFAKAFWGEEMESKIIQSHGYEALYTTKAWKLHLGNMVLEEEPLKYLEKFL